MVYISRFDIGNDIWEVQASELGVTGVSACSSFVSAHENSISRQAAEELKEYFSGKRTSFSVPLAPEGTCFQKQVWEALCGIPFGTTAAYCDIARQIGKPKAVRAVGQAIGKNPCLVLIPCHRVIGRDGSLTGFSAGMPLKIRLLELEGIPVRK